MKQKNSIRYRGNFRKTVLKISSVVFAFIIVFSPISTAASDEWESTGLLGTTTSGMTDSSYAVSGSTPYVSYIDSDTNELRIKKYNGTEWVSVGSALQDVYSASIAVVGITPYIAYMNTANSNRLAVKRLASSGWEDVGTVPSTVAGYPTIALDGSTPYISYMDTTNSNYGTVIRYNGTQWETVGGAGFTSSSIGLPMPVAISNSVPYAISTDTEDGSVTVYRFNGSTWQIVGGDSLPLQGYYVSLVLNGGSPYISYTDISDEDNPKPTVMKYNGTSWEDLGVIQGTGVAMNNALAFNGSTPYVIYSDYSTGFKVKVVKFDGSDWVTVGQPSISDDQAMMGVLIAGGSTLHALYMQGSDTLSLLAAKYRLASNNVAQAPNAETEKLVQLTVDPAADLNHFTPIKESGMERNDALYDYPLGLVDFSFVTDKENNDVSLLFVTDLNPDQVIVRKYNPTSKQYSTITNATVTKTTHEGKNALLVNYVIQDNGDLDANPTVGLIDDPVGLAVAQIPGAPNTGARPSYGSAMWVVGAVLFVIAAAFVRKADYLR